MTTLVLATRNAYKVGELRALLADLPVAIRSLADYPAVPDVPETGATFAENAALKARAVAAATGHLALADDSGLVVDALGGAPGIRSSRFAGPGATDRDRVDRVLALMKDVPEERRAARFVAAVAVAAPGGEARTVVAACEGRIAFAPRGEHGFGYDPIFLIPDRGLTMAELPPEEKNRISHRAQAIARAREALREVLGA
ncbi:MAG: XTP/dITP diphosphatase [Armatimonadetes bacterium]|nr:XTP/dITP diphosphatase [Armatimonadota bacterium]